MFKVQEYTEQLLKKISKTISQKLNKRWRQINNHKQLKWLTFKKVCKNQWQNQILYLIYIFKKK